MKRAIPFLLILAMATPGVAQWSVGYSTGAIGTPALTIKSKTNSGNLAIIPGNTTDTSVFQGLAVEYKWKRFGVAADFMWHAFQSGHQPFTLTNNDPNWGTLAASRLSGDVFGLTVLAKYYQPITRTIDWYIGVGPGFIGAVIEGSDLHLGHAYAFAPALVAETGVRAYILANFSADLFFRYRYSHPQYEFHIGVDGPPLYMSFGYNNLMGGLRLSYHF